MVPPVEGLEHVYQAALEIQAFCRDQGWKFCFIGGIAVQRWGEPRLTQDADVTVLSGFGGEEVFVDALLKRFQGRRPDARDFALQARVVLLQTTAGTALDIALGAIPFEERSVQRASNYDFGIRGDPIELITCGAEDLVVHKCFAGRDQDWLDVERILQRQNRRLNLALIREELAPLVALKEQPEILERFERKLGALGLSGPQ